MKFLSLFLSLQILWTFPPPPPLVWALHFGPFNEARCWTNKCTILSSIHPFQPSLSFTSMPPDTNDYGLPTSSHIPGQRSSISAQKLVPTGQSSIRRNVALGMRRNLWSFHLREAVHDDIFGRLWPRLNPLVGSVSTVFTEGKHQRLTRFFYEIVDCYWQ